MAIKTVILLRHGQYTSDPTEKLTALGRKQAKLAGKRLKSVGINKLYVSTMPRANETAKIVIKEINWKKRLHKSDFLRECVPGFPIKLQKKYGHTDKKKLAANKKQAERGYREVFQFSKSERTELVVCHGNLIRFFLCKAIGVKTDSWTKFDIKQCGITVLQLNSKTRELKIISHNDTGHIPLHLQTYI